MEFEHKQSEFRNTSITALLNASKTLNKYNLEFKQFDAESLVPTLDLIELVKKSNVNVSLLEPDIDDYNDAHKRACLHLAPHPPKIESDEMRDLVIWSLALKTAKASDGAMLISRDKVHINGSGDDEAAKVKLIRVNSLEAALEYMNVETPNGQFVLKYLTAIWDDLIKSGLPLSKNLSVNSIKNIKLVHGKVGPSQISCSLKITSSDNKDFSTDLIMFLDDETIRRISLENIFHDNKQQGRKEIETSVRVTIEENDYVARLRDLQNLID
ncbi:MAG: hypothetical protein M3Y85_09040 [Bacteroidota bacterium]|nr:hypothetical protein [Bacteroidota bacterium]